MESRRAQASDAREVVDLWVQLIEFYGEHFSHYGGDLQEDLLLRSFHHMLEEDSFHILVVSDPGIVATCTLHLNRFSSWSGSYYGTLEDFIVHQDSRREGIGRALLSKALEEAREEGLSRLELHVLSGNLPARKLYERLGFSGNDSLVYSIMLEKEET